MAGNPRNPFSFILGLGIFMSSITSFVVADIDLPVPTIVLTGPSLILANEWTEYNCSLYDVHHPAVTVVVWYLPPKWTHRVIREIDLTRGILVKADPSTPGEIFDVTCAGEYDIPNNLQFLNSTISVTLRAAPTHMEISGPRVARAGIKQVWRCRAKGSRPAAELSWFLNGQLTFQDINSSVFRASDKSIVVDSDLTFTPVSPLRWVNLTCVGSVAAHNLSTTTRFSSAVVLLKLPEGMQEVATKTWMGGFASGIIIIMATLLSIVCCPCLTRRRVPIDSEVESESTDYGNKIEL